MPGQVSERISAGATALSYAMPIITASSAYTAGNEVGGLLAFPLAVGPVSSGLLQSILVQSKSVQTGAFKLYLFSKNPTNTTWTDKSAPAINALDVPFLIGVFTLSTADSGLGTHTLYQLDNIAKAIFLASTTLYGVMVTSGTPTFASTSDLTVGVGVRQDF